jgi:hypothetical protein
MLLTLYNNVIVIQSKFVYHTSMHQIHALSWNRVRSQESETFSLLFYVGDKVQDGHLTAAL